MKRPLCWLVLFLGMAFSLPSMANITLAELSDESQTALEQGNYSRASSLLANMQEQANKAHDGYWQTWALSLQGYLALQQREFQQAERLLGKALATAKTSAWPELIARIHLYRGQLRQNTGQWPEAEQDYRAAEQASATGLPEMAASATLHRATLAQHRQAYDDSAKLLQTAAQGISRLPENASRVHLALDVGYQWLQLRGIAPAVAPLESIFSALSKALELAKKLH